MTRRGYRYRRGEAHPRAKLTDDDVRLVRQLHDTGLGYGEIGKKFNVSRFTVRDVCKHKIR
jgi:orotate phosphoribosyltransferase-like protein